MSERTLARRFEAELGMSLRSWRRRLRLFKAIELLGGGFGVTRTALELGYSSTSAFVYAFRTEMGRSPQAYMRGRSADQSVRATLLG
jgi:AraC-like DNA-binding protein